MVSVHLVQQITGLAKQTPKRLRLCFLDLRDSDDEGEISTAPDVVVASIDDADSS
ncbi:hypothetical protein PtrSN002B_012182, partial [Pyrenophora tritici-repentis]